MQYRLVERAAFNVVGRQTWISGQDNSLFARFWQSCQTDGLFQQFERINALRPGAQTNGVTLGVSRVDADPSRRSFYYMIGVEVPDAASGADLEVCRVPASLWAGFECRGHLPEALAASEIYAFSEWLPVSGYTHAHAPELEVYPPAANAGKAETYCEFWLPITPV